MRCSSRLVRRAALMELDFEPSGGALRAPLVAGQAAR